MQYKVIPYNSILKPRAKKLRKNMTCAEKLLWVGLKCKKLGYDFDRQKPINNYIVDFYCKELKVAIEVDGLSHEGKYEYDKMRQDVLEKLVIKVFRIKDEDVKKDLDGVLVMIEEFIKDLSAWRNPPRSTA